MDEKRYIELCWKLLEYKLMYYLPGEVHPDWHEKLTISDQIYDGLEQEYLALAKKLNKSNRIVTELVDFPRDLPCGKLVMSKYSLSKAQLKKKVKQYATTR